MSHPKFAYQSLSGKTRFYAKKSPDKIGKTIIHSLKPSLSYTLPHPFNLGYVNLLDFVPVNLELTNTPAVLQGKAWDPNVLIRQ